MVMSVCLYHTLPEAFGGQKKVSYLLELEFQVVVSHQVGAENSNLGPLQEQVFSTLVSAEEDEQWLPLGASEDSARMGATPGSTEDGCSAGHAEVSDVCFQHGYSSDQAQ